MELWHGLVKEFIKEGKSEALSGKMMLAFWNHHRYQPSDSEVRSWDNSLKRLAEFSENSNLQDCGIVLEYHLPYSGSRIDAIYFGKDEGDNNVSTILELKQWSTVELLDEYSLNISVNGKEHIHPSQQALDYANHLEEIQSTYQDHKIITYPCSYCHNLTRPSQTLLEDVRFSEILQFSPLFTTQNQEKFSNFMQTNVGYGSGINLMNHFINGRFKPNKKLLEVLDSVINQEEKWHLLGTQRLAYNAIWAKVLKLTKTGSSKQQFAVLVRGGPGTGKSVIAAQLLADALRNEFTAVHSTGGKAFTINLRAQFKGADKLFAWNMNMRNQTPLGVDLLLVDEAHRIRTTSNTRWTRAVDRTGKSQIEELLTAAKVTVFFLDENQYVRPDEIGDSCLIRDATAKLQISLIEFDLATQFRCGNSFEYISWLDYILGFEEVPNGSWKLNYEFKLVDSPEDLDLMLAKAKQDGDSARIVAGFCWPWSNPNKDGTLVNDVKIDDWERPWNAKAMKSTYPPEKHPYTLWANTQEGEKQIGCIYSSQGFEFDKVGVIWGKDLVWRDGGWVVQRQYSHDNPVKAKTADSLRLLRNAYRVLLTRGIKGTHLLCLDEETRIHLKEEIAKVC